MDIILIFLLIFVPSFMLGFSVAHEDITTETYDECNIAKPAGTECVIEYGYIAKEVKE